MKMTLYRLKGLKEWNVGTYEGESEDLNPSLPYGDFFVYFGGEEEKDFLILEYYRHELLQKYPTRVAWYFFQLRIFPMQKALL